MDNFAFGCMTDMESIYPIHQTHVVWKEPGERENYREHGS